METRYGLVMDSVTSPDVLANRIREFLAPLRDGHTNIQRGNSEWWRHSQARFLPMNQGIIYTQILPAQYKNLLGSKLVGIENMSIQDVLTGFNQCAESAALLWREDVDIHLEQFAGINTLVDELLDAGHCAFAVGSIGDAKPL